MNKSARKFSQIASLALCISILVARGVPANKKSHVIVYVI